MVMAKHETGGPELPMKSTGIRAATRDTVMETIVKPISREP
jgi:hypothetical protein